MSFFDFFNRASNEQPSAPSNDDAPVVIFVEPGNEVTIPAAEAKGKTLGQLFGQYAEALGIDAQQIERFTAAGTLVSGTATPTPGTVYRGSANSFVKGSRSDLPAFGQIDWLLR